MTRRKGFSLMEVLLATATLLGCVIVLTQLANIGRRHAANADDLAVAQRLCQNKLNEMLCGAAPMTAVENESLSLEEQAGAGWVYSVEITPVSRGLSSLRVTVAQEESETVTNPLHFTLVRWVRSPQGYSQDEDLLPTAGDDMLPMPESDQP